MTQRENLSIAGGCASAAALRADATAAITIRRGYQHADQRFIAGYPQHVIMSVA
jgi:hypothetical protein